MSCRVGLRLLGITKSLTPSPLFFSGGQAHCLWCRANKIVLSILIHSPSIPYHTHTQKLPQKKYPPLSFQKFKNKKFQIKNLTLYNTIGILM